MDASELHARRLNAKEVFTPQRSGNFIFPVADGTVKIFGREQRLRTSTLTRDRLERGEEREILRGKSDELRSPTPLQEDSTRMMRKLKSDFWSITGEFIYRHHVEPRVKLYVLKEESFPIPMKYIDVTRKTHTPLDMLLEKILKITGTWMEKKNCQMHEQASQDLFFKRKGRQKDTHGSGGDVQGDKPPLVLMMYGQICGSICLMQQKESKTKMGYRETKARVCQTTERNILH